MAGDIGYALDRELLTEAAYDKSITDSQFRLLATAKSGQMRPEVLEWACKVVENAFKKEVE